MKFTKGIILGTLVTAGTMMMYSDSIDSNKRKMMKKGKQMIKKMNMHMEENKPHIGSGLFFD